MLKYIYLILFLFNITNTSCCCKCCCNIGIPEISFNKNTHENKILYRNIKLYKEVDSLTGFSHRLDSFCLLRNNRIGYTYGGKFGVINFENNKKLSLKNLYKEECDEYCFNDIIELKNGDLLLLSEDGTIKIFRINKSKDGKLSFNLIQKIYDDDKDPIYTVKELENGDLITGIWSGFKVYSKVNNEYKIKTRCRLNRYCFSILEVKPNVVAVTNCSTEELKIIDLNKIEGKNIVFFKKDKPDNFTSDQWESKNDVISVDIDSNIDGITTIKDIRSGERPNLQYYLKDCDLLFIGYEWNKSEKDKGGVNVVSINQSKLLGCVNLNSIVTAVCPISYNKDVREFDLLCAVKERIYGEKVNYKYDLIQLKFNLNDISDVRFKIVGKKERVHFNEIRKVQYNLPIDYELKESNKNIIPYIFTHGSEDKTFKVFGLDKNRKIF